MTSEPPEYGTRGPIDTDWITDDHLRYVADVLAAFNRGEHTSNGPAHDTWPIQFVGTVEVIAGGEPGVLGHLIGWMKPIDYPGAWSFIPRSPHAVWKDDGWVDMTTLRDPHNEDSVET